MKNNQDFNMLIFAQRWPITHCIQWMDSSSDNECILSSLKDMWVIHGIWPSRSDVGPTYCNKTAHFDVNQLNPLIAQLDQFWSHVEKGFILFEFYSQTE